ncbi:MAG: hypothetical protein GY874_00710 [Desulfobacteraceae bacterium]|nr:hypothetical protein [Desulfobacteraceae bacterium]
MKTEILYEKLKNIAEKLELNVSEKSFRNTGIRIKSGFCIVKDQAHIIIDKHLRLNRKTEVLGECLCEFAYDSIQIESEVRDFLESFTPSNKTMEN